MKRIFDKINTLEANIIRLSEKLERQQKDNLSLVADKKQLKIVVTSREHRIKELEDIASKNDVLLGDNEKNETLWLKKIKKTKEDFAKLLEENKNLLLQNKRLAGLEKEIELRDMLLGQSKVKEENLSQKIEILNIDFSKLLAEHRTLKKEAQDNIVKINDWNKKIAETRTHMEQHKMKEEAMMQKLKKEVEIYVKNFEKGVEWLNQ